MAEWVESMPPPPGTHITSFIPSPPPAPSLAPIPVPAPAPPSVSVPVLFPSPATSPSPTTNLKDDQSQLHPNTYVVHVPKDQIYRIPPPENAYLVERYRNDHQSRQKRRSPCVSFLCWLVVIFIILAIVVLALIVAFFLFVRPSLPSFTVERLLVKSSLSSKKSHMNLDINFQMKSWNPSFKMGFSYKSGGKAVLAHKGVDLVLGGTPHFYQGYRNSTTFKLALDESKAKLPKEIERSLKGSKEIVPLLLSINFPIRLRIWGVELKNMRINTKCDMKVRRLGKGAQIMWQDCGSKLKI